MDDLEADLFGDEGDLGYDAPNSDDEADANKKTNTQANDSALSNKIKAKIRDLALGKLAEDAAKTRRTRPKLDTNVLLSDRGLPRLAELTKKVRLKGRNHEVEDLRTIMHIYEYWAHTMSPQLAFDDVVRRIEMLGQKREIKTWLNKMRLNMLVDDNVIVQHDDDDDHLANETAKRNDPTSTANQNPSAVTAPFDEVDDLFEADPFDYEIGGGIITRPNNDALLYADADSDSFSAAKVTSVNLHTTPAESGNSALSEETRKRIEENRRRAIERRSQILKERSNPSQSLAEMDSHGSEVPNAPTNTTTNTNANTNTNTNNLNNRENDDEDEDDEHPLQIMDAID